MFVFFFWGGGCDFGFGCGFVGVLEGLGDVGPGGPHIKLTLPY